MNTKSMMITKNDDEERDDHWRDGDHEHDNKHNNN